MIIRIIGAVAAIRGQQSIFLNIYTPKLTKNAINPQILQFKEYSLDFPAFTSAMALLFHFVDVVVLLELEYEVAIRTASLAPFIKLERRVIKVVRNSTSIVPRTP